MAPTCANIFKHYVKDSLPLPFQLQPTAYFRYIDYIYIVWPHGIDTLATLIENANKTHHKVSFNHEYSKIAE